MSSTIVSYIVQCWQENAFTHLKVVRVDTGEEVSLGNGSFLLRFFIDDETLVERCFIQHLTSSREVYVQSGAGLLAFIRACLSDEANTHGPPDPGMPGA